MNIPGTNPLLVWKIALYDRYYEGDDVIYNHFGEQVRIIKYLYSVNGESVYSVIEHPSDEDIEVAINHFKFLRTHRIL